LTKEKHMQRGDDKHTPRYNFARPDLQFKLANMTRTHHECREVAGVNRPGKTAKDRWLRAV
jgi:hypothetical protein